ncbi:hypothetical protein M0R45_006251 [Rubus argutus]|uniref:Uncharacterized protein n=1 Tax=Rubus argutus TaxID=59490 RepID=A0AAW1YQF8_RUBAR
MLIASGTQLQLLCFDRSPRPSPYFTAASLCSDQSAHPCTQTDAAKPSFSAPPSSLQTTPKPSGSDQIPRRYTQTPSPPSLMPRVNASLHQYPWSLTVGLATLITAGCNLASLFPPASLIPESKRSLYRVSSLN